MLLTLAFLGLMALSGGLPQDDCSSQSIFSVLPEAETHIGCPVTLPLGARFALAHNPFIRGVMRDEGARELPPSWFTAAYVRLGPPGEKDLLIIGNGPLLGANVDPIWVLRPTAAGWKIIVDGAPTLSVKVSQHRTNGYHDLLISKATAVQAYTGVLRFDGQVYRLAEGAWTPIR